MVKQLTTKPCSYNGTKRCKMDKKRVMFSVSQIKIKTAQFVLKSAGIESFVLNKMDSAHVGLFGDIQLYVSEEHSAEARRILEEEEVI